jgi:acyl-CoA thioesterase
VADQSAGAPGAFDRDTAVDLRERAPDGTVSFAVEISPDWRAGRGPHGGYLAAMLLRALTETVSDPARTPRSLTIHYARAPEPGPAEISCAIERAGRSLSTLSARMEQDGRLIALALCAFSVPWTAEEVSELPMPDVAPPDDARGAGAQIPLGAPLFTRHLVLQPRTRARPFAGSDAPMEIAGWLGLEEPRAIDALSLAFFSDALFSPPMIRFSEPVATPTVDLTIHFRATEPRTGPADPNDLCFARFRSGVVHEGFFEEDGVIWAPDGTVLAQSRQLGVVIPVHQV